MKTVDPSSKTADPAQRPHPEVLTAPPSRAGVLGTILTELEFGEDEHLALQDLGEYLVEKLDFFSATFSTRARQIAFETESMQPVNILTGPPSPRPSIRRLRRHAAHQWLRTTLLGDFDSQFSHHLRNIWMPILIAERDQGRPVPAVTRAFLDYVEGYLTAWLIDGAEENVVPTWRMIHALRVAIDVQRRILGIETIHD